MIFESEKATDRTIEQELLHVKARHFHFDRDNFAMEMKNVIAREGREAKNLILYHLSSEDESELQHKSS